MPIYISGIQKKVRFKRFSDEMRNLVRECYQINKHITVAKATIIAGIKSKNGFEKYRYVLNVLIKLQLKKIVSSLTAI